MNLVLSFRYRVELDNKKNWLTIGRYPAVTLARARDVALEYSQLIARGINPKEFFEKQKTLNIKIADLCSEYLEHKAPLIRKKEQSLKDLTRTILNEIVARIGDSKLSDLTSELVHKKLIQPKIHDSPAAVKRNIITLKQVANYAVELGYISTNPINRIDIASLYKDKVRERYLTFDELGIVLNNMYKANIRTQWKIAIHLLVLLLVRKNELLQSQWEQIDLSTAVFHLTENKTSRLNLTPLAGHKLCEDLQI